MIDQVMQQADQYDILIVDDTTDSLELLGRILENRGYRVRAANNGRHALKSVEVKVPDLILLDVKMPEMDGYEVCRHLKAGKSSSNIPVIFISGFGEIAEKVKGFKAGAVDYITKPYDTQEVMARVQTHLQLRELTDHLEQLVYDRTVKLQSANQRLRESEQRYRTLFESAGDTIIIFDLKERLIAVNNSACERLGYSRNELLQMTSRDIDAPGHVTFSSGRIEKIRTQGSAFFESAHSSRDGTVIDIELNNRLIEYAGNQAILCIIRDITKRKRAEETLRKLYHAMDQSPASIILTDTSGRIEYVNPKFTEVTGYSKAEALGKNPKILKSGEVPPATYEQLWETVTSGNVWRGELLNKKKNGVFFWESATISPIFDAAGVITHFIGLKQDITEQKNLEEQLRQLQKLEAFGQLAGGVAHDFNNTLTVIMGNTEMALMDIPPSDPLHAKLQIVNDAAQRSAELTKQLLAFARKQRVTPKILNLNDTIADILKMLKRLIGEDIDLIWKPAKKLWPVKIDPSQINQIMANLCVNARDAVNGVGKVTIETRNTTLDEVYCTNFAEFVPGDYVQLIVSDDGCGMDEETQAHLFEPFFTTKEIGQGTGLGLATVYGIIKQNKGFIYVYSEKGLGSTFKIYFQPDKTNQVKSQMKELDAALPRGTETVLMVDDEMEILNLGHNILKNLGYSVLIAKTPSEAIRLAEKNSKKISLLLTDLVMPEMNGRILAERITAIIPGLNCLYMSGYTTDIIKSQGVMENEIHLIQKPFSIKGLAVKVREMIDKKPVSGKK